MFENIDAILETLNPATKAFELSETILLPGKTFRLTVNSGIGNANVEEDFEVD